jgi:hypothetical protein
LTAPLSAPRERNEGERGRWKFKVVRYSVAKGNGQSINYEKKPLLLGYSKIKFITIVD